MVTGYSISGSKNNWFWCVWQTESRHIYLEIVENIDNLPPFYGRGSSKEDCLQALKSRFEGDLVCLNSHYAARVRSALHQQKKAASPKAKSATKQQANLGYLYTHHVIDRGWEGLPDEIKNVRHRILKITPKFVYIGSMTDGSAFGAEAPSSRLSKTKLDETGRCWCREIRDFVYKEPHSQTGSIIPRLAPAIQKALEILGLPSDELPHAPEIKSAYRRRVLEVHPDRGGDDATFRDVNAAYEMLIST